MMMFTKPTVVHYFIMYVSQIIMLDTLNLHSALCQLNLNKTGRKENHVGGQRILG